MKIKNNKIFRYSLLSLIGITYFFWYINISNANLDFCSDNSLLRYVSKDMPLKDKKYKPDYYILTNDKSIIWNNVLLLNKKEVDIREKIEIRKEMLSDLKNLLKELNSKKVFYQLVQKNIVENWENNEQLRTIFDIETFNKNKKEDFITVWKIANNNWFVLNTTQEEENKYGIKFNPFSYRYVWKDFANTLIINKRSLYEYQLVESKYKKDKFSCFKPLEHINPQINTNQWNIWGVAWNWIVPSDTNLNNINIRTEWFWPDWVFPWTFDGIYRDLDKSILNLLRVNLVVSDSFLQMENNFSMQNNWPFSEIYADALKYAQSWINAENSKYQEKALKIMQSDLIKYLAVKVMPAISLRERSWEIKINPNFNLQGIFQSVNAENYIKNPSSCKNDVAAGVYPFYSKCDNLARIYQKWKVLTKEEQLEQFINMYMFLNTKARDMDKKVLDNSNQAYSYNANLQYMIEWINDELWLSQQEIEELKVNLITKNTVYINNFLQRKGHIMSKYWVFKPEDFYVWLDYIYVGAILTNYNGQWNNWYYRKVQRKVIRFILDHPYASNSPQYWVCFQQCAVDGCAYLNINKTQWWLYQFIKSNYQPSDVERYSLWYWVLIQKWWANWKLLMKAPSCKR